MARSELFRPARSTQAKLVETRSDGLRIYSHTSRKLSGSFIVVRDDMNWATCDTLEQARADIWGGL